MYGDFLKLYDILTTKMRVLLDYAGNAHTRILYESATIRMLKDPDIKSKIRDTILVLATVKFSNEFK
jgi:hypothetical protein